MLKIMKDIDKNKNDTWIYRIKGKKERNKEIGRKNFRKGENYWQKKKK